MNLKEQEREYMTYADRIIEEIFLGDKLNMGKNEFSEIQILLYRFYPIILFNIAFGAQILCLKKIQN